MPGADRQPEDLAQDLLDPVSGYVVRRHHQYVRLGLLAAAVFVHSHGSQLCASPRTVHPGGTGGTWGGHIALIALCARRRTPYLLSPPQGARNRDDACPRPELAGPEPSARHVRHLGPAPDRLRRVGPAHRLLPAG